MAHVRYSEFIASTPEKWIVPLDVISTLSSGSELTILKKPSFNWVNVRLNLSYTGDVLENYLVASNLIKTLLSKDSNVQFKTPNADGSFTTYTLKDIDLGIMMNGCVKLIHKSKQAFFSIEFKDTNASGDNFSKLLSEIVNHFEIPQDNIHKISDFCQVPICGRKSVMEIAKLGDFNSAIKFAGWTGNVNIQQELVDYFISEEIKRVDHALSCFKLILANKKLRQNEEAYHQIIFKLAKTLDNNFENSELEDQISKMLIDEVKTDVKLVWKLAQYFHDLGEYKYTAQFIEFLPESDANFHDAHHMLAMMLSESLSHPVLSDSERLEMKKMTLSHLFLAVPKYQKELDRVYNDFCGNPMRKENVKIELSIDTLFELSQEMKVVNEENKRLKAPRKDWFFPVRSGSKKTTEDVPHRPRSYTQ